MTVLRWLGWIGLQLAIALVVYECALHAVALLCGPVRSDVSISVLVDYSFRLVILLAALHAAALVWVARGRFRSAILQVCIGLWFVWLVRPATAAPHRIGILLFVAGACGFLAPTLVRFTLGRPSGHALPPSNRMPGLHGAAEQRRAPEPAQWSSTDPGAPRVPAR
jgi:hypothetical protein